MVAVNITQLKNIIVGHEVKVIRLKSAFGSTVDFSCVEKSVGSVWFVRAIRNSPSLWYAQTIRFDGFLKATEIHCTTSSTNTEWELYTVFVLNLI